MKHATRETDHTPAPWELTVHEDRFEINMGTALEKGRIGHEYQHQIVLNWETDDGGDEQEAEQLDEAFANARLIAAAPDLLAALQQATDELEYLHHFGVTQAELRSQTANLLPVMRAALAKTRAPE